MERGEREEGEVKVNERGREEEEFRFLGFEDNDRRMHVGMEEREEDNGEMHERGEDVREVRVEEVVNGNERGRGEEEEYHRFRRGKFGSS